jgi:hypothetical protein
MPRTTHSAATPTNGNPNAIVAGGGTGLGVALVWFLGNVWPHVSLSAEAGAGIAGGIGTVVLFFGRNGLVGVKNALLHGWRK